MWYYTKTLINNKKWNLAHVKRRTKWMYMLICSLIRSNDIPSHINVTQVICILLFDNFGLNISALHLVQYEYRKKTAIRAGMTILSNVGCAQIMKNFPEALIDNGKFLENFVFLENQEFLCSHHWLKHLYCKI